MNAGEIVRQLRGVQERHAHDKLLTFQTDISAMARDCANMIESLQAQLAAEKRRERAAVECDDEVRCVQQQVSLKGARGNDV